MLRFGSSSTRNLPGALETTEITTEVSAEESTDAVSVSQRAGDRGRTGDVQLGKLAFYH
jgi:hypothetical protein